MQFPNYLDIIFNFTYKLDMVHLLMVQRHYPPVYVLNQNMKDLYKKPFLDINNHIFIEYLKDFSKGNE